MTQSTDPFEQPLYDATRPIACTIQAADLPNHVTLLERIRINMQSIQRTPHGVLIALPSTAANAADLRRFAAEEKACCEFWGFDVIEHPDLAMRWDGPP